MELKIFLLFLRISCISFGGIFGTIPEMERLIVDENGWISRELFLEAYALGQFLPGPNMAMCPIIGYWMTGWSGFVAAFLGIYSMPVVMMGVLYRLYHRYRTLPRIRRIELGLRPVVVGLMIASALRLWWVQTATGDHPYIQQGISIALLSGAIYLLHKRLLPPLVVVFLGGMFWLALSFYLDPQIWSVNTPWFHSPSELFDLDL